MNKVGEHIHISGAFFQVGRDYMDEAVIIYDRKSYLEFIYRDINGMRMGTSVDKETLMHWLQHGLQIGG